MEQPACPSKALRALRSHSTKPMHLAIAACIALVLFLLLNTNPEVLTGRAWPHNVEALWRNHLDSKVYRAGAQALLDGHNIYLMDYQVGDAQLPFTYPPLAAMLMMPLTLLPPESGAVLLNACSAGALWWVIALVLRRCLPTWTMQQAAGTSLFLLTPAMALEPVRATLAFGQINLLLMALVATDILLVHRRLPRGVLVGLAAAIKLTPAVFGLYFLCRRQYRAAAWCAGSGLLSSAVAWMIAPELSRTYWFQTLQHTDRIGEVWYTANQSYQGMLHRLGSSEHSVWVVLSAITIVWIAALMIGWSRSPGGRRLHNSTAPSVNMAPSGNTARIEACSGERRQAPSLYPYEGLRASAVLCANAQVALLLSPVSWSHHWVWTVPTIVTLAVAALRTRHIAVSLAAVAWTAATLLAPFWWFPQGNDAELHWNLPQQLFGNSYVELSVATLVASGIALVRQLRREAASTSVRAAS